MRELTSGCGASLYSQVQLDGKLDDNIDDGDGDGISNLTLRSWSSIKMARPGLFMLRLAKISQWTMLSYDL